MDTPVVLNIRQFRYPPPDSVYIGRNSKWGNPFVIGLDGSREEVIKKYKEALSAELLEAAKIELKGKNLVCFCAPLPCHGDFLLKVANS